MFSPVRPSRRSTGFHQSCSQEGYSASAIKSLKREYKHLRRDRDLLKQELAKLAVHLDSSQLEPVAACVSTNEDAEQRTGMDLSMVPFHYEHMQAQPECRQYPRIY